jgi:GT2 family glycosyltransferase
LVSAGIALPCAENPRVSILIAAFGGDRFENCLRSLAERLGERPAVEVIAVLNGTGPQIRAVARAASGLRVIDPPVNLGFPGGCNMARSIARGDYLVLVQDDGRIASGWLEALVEVADAHPEAGLVGSVTLWPGGERIMQAGQVLFSDGSLREVAAGESPSTLDGRGPFAVDTLSSHGMLVRAGTWDAVGGLEEDYFPLYLADLTISRQVWARGEAVLCAPNARAEHSRHSSTKPRFRTFVFNRHFEKWRGRWGDEVAQLEPPGVAVEDAVERALARADTAWRLARPGPAPSILPAPPYDPEGDEQQRLMAGIRFAGLAIEVRDSFGAALEENLDRVESELARAHEERTRLEHELADSVTGAAQLRAELDVYRGHEAELADLRHRALTLAAIEAGGWWRLRARLLPVLRCGGWLRRLRAR